MCAIEDYRGLLICFSSSPPLCPKGLISISSPAAVVYPLEEGLCHNSPFPLCWLDVRSCAFLLLRSALILTHFNSEFNLNISPSLFYHVAIWWLLLWSMSQIRLKSLNSSTPCFKIYSLIKWWHNLLLVGSDSFPLGSGREPHSIVLHCTPELWTSSCVSWRRCWSFQFLKFGLTRSEHCIDLRQHLYLFSASGFKSAREESWRQLYFSKFINYNMQPECMIGTNIKSSRVKVSCDSKAKPVCILRRLRPQTPRSETFCRSFTPSLRVPLPNYTLLHQAHDSKPEKFGQPSNVTFEMARIFEVDLSRKDSVCRRAEWSKIIVWVHQ